MNGQELRGETKVAALRFSLTSLSVLVCNRDGGVTHVIILTEQVI